MKNGDDNEANTLKQLKIHKSCSCFKKKNQKEVCENILIEQMLLKEYKQIFNQKKKFWVGEVVIIKGTVMEY